MAWKRKKGKNGKSGSNSEPPAKAAVAQAKAKATVSVLPSAAKPEPVAAGEPKAAAVKALGSAVQKAQFAQMFSQAVGVLMRDAQHRNLPIRDLEFLLLPPLMAGQCVVGHAKLADDGALLPVALALWARVSPSVDKRLQDSVDRPVPLKPNEWTSGNIIWLVTLAGSPRALSDLVKQLCQKDLKGQVVKMLVADTSGKRVVHVLKPEAPKTPV
jgi:cytolysin-activating lysine-acyltransferase